MDKPKTYTLKLEHEGLLFVQNAISSVTINAVDSHHVSKVLTSVDKALVGIVIKTKDTK